MIAVPGSATTPEATGESFATADSTRTVAFVTPSNAPRWKRWLLFSPLARIVWFVAMLIVSAIAYDILLRHIFGWKLTNASNLQRLLFVFGMELTAAGIAYLGLVTWFERRKADELSVRSMPRNYSAGLAGGAALFSAVVGVLWLVGSYHIVAIDPHADWLPGVLVWGVCVGLAEEIISRGALFRISEEGMGTWFALVVSAAFFGAMHAWNQGATLWSSTAIAIEAGLLLAMLYHVTRSLWTCAGMHAAWNVMQGTVYGIPVSGIPEQGFVVSKMTGPDWLSGGAFGAEASVVSVAMCSLCTIALVVIAVRRGTIVPPFWKR